MKDNVYSLIKSGQGGFDINTRGIYIGYQKADTAEKMINVSEQTGTLHFVVKGHGNLQLAGKNLYVLKGGTAFYIPKGVKASYWPIMDDPYEYYRIWVDVFDSDKFFENIGFTKTRPVIYSEQKVIDLVQELYETAKLGTVVGGYKGLSLLYEVFSNFAGQCEEKEPQINENEYVLQAVDYINAKYYDDINVNKIADALNINRSYFSTLFKNKMGVTPLNYLTKFRIMQACKLLAMDKNVTEVAILTGFNTPANFTINFKRIMNTTPLEYKKQLKIKGE